MFVLHKLLLRTHTHTHTHTLKHTYNTVPMKELCSFGTLKILHLFYTDCFESGCSPQVQ